MAFWKTSVLYLVELEMFLVPVKNRILVMLKDLLLNPTPSYNSLQLVTVAS